jgi:hypothetical protein
MNFKTFIYSFVLIILIQNVYSQDVVLRKKAFIDTSIENLKEIKRQSDNVEYYYKNVQYSLGAASIGGNVPVLLSYLGLAAAMPTILPIAGTIGTVGILGSGIWKYYIDRENTRLFNMVNFELDKLINNLILLDESDEIINLINKIRGNLVKEDPNTKLVIEAFLGKVALYAPELKKQIESIIVYSQNLNLKQSMTYFKDQLEKIVPKLKNLDPSITLGITIFMEIIEFSNVYESKSELSERVQILIDSLEKTKEKI